MFDAKTWFFIDVGFCALNLAMFVSTGSFFSLAIAALCGWCGWEAYKKWKNL